MLLNNFIMSFLSLNSLHSIDNYLSLIKMLKFAIATDLHLGHKEHHPIRGLDSFAAFQEVLQIAHSQAVDFLLIGGDLFDTIKPEPTCLFKAINLLKKYAWGQGNIQFQLKGMQTNFHSESNKIAMPIFTIHGNHDYPSFQLGKLSVCDLMHASNFLNYFGKYGGQRIKVSPLLFQKQNCKLALYGLGHIKDMRLNRMLNESKIEFEEVSDQYIKILILHQNKHKGSLPGASYQQSVKPSQFPSWFNLIIWCHQHQSIPKIELEVQGRAGVYQPGSTIITSMIEAESRMKHCGIFTIQSNVSTKFYPVFLKRSFRRLILKDITLEALREPGFLKNHVAKATQEYQDLVGFYIEQVLREYQVSEDLQHYEGESLKKPLLRVKVDQGLHSLRAKMIQQRFSNRVANPDEIIKVYKKRTQKPLAQPLTNITLQDKLQAIQTRKPQLINEQSTMKQIKQIFLQSAQEGKVIPLHVFSSLVFNPQRKPSEISQKLKYLQDQLKAKVRSQLSQDLRSSDHEYCSLIRQYKSNDDLPDYAFTRLTSLSQKISQDIASLSSAASKLLKKTTGSDFYPMPAAEPKATKKVKKQFQGNNYFLIESESDDEKCCTGKHKRESDDRNLQEDFRNAVLKAERKDIPRAVKQTTLLGFKR